MTAVPFTGVCSMLDVDAKTLRQWLKHSNLSLHQSPMDARVKCLTIEQVQQLAILHGRSIKSGAVSPPEPPPASLASVQPEKAVHLQPTSQLSSLSAHSDLMKSLSSLEATVANLQQQVAQLALELVHERELRYERRLSTLEALIEPCLGLTPGTKPPEISAPACPQNEVAPSQRRPNPAELRARSRVLPLIEYAADGTYVIISPQEGELFFTPDSQEWFDWLATLSSFRFLGQQGRLSASRSSGRPCWMAYRRIHGHCYSYGLGNTKRLTLAHLEQMAATLQSYVPSLS